MNNYKIGVLLLIFWLPLSAQAAVEYLRFEGIIFAIAPGATPYGFETADPVYFDFQIDTAEEASGQTDGGTFDYFAVTYLGGSVSLAPNETYGFVQTVMDGTLSEVFIDDFLSIGQTVEDLPGNLGIDAWEPGEFHSLIYSPASGSDIGLVQMTYRGATLPPAIVPLPASVGFYALTLFLLSLAVRVR